MNRSAIEDSEFRMVELRSVLLRAVVGTLDTASSVVDALLFSVRPCSGIEELDWLEECRFRKPELESD